MTENATRIATFGPSHCAIPFVLAKINREFEEEGLRVQLRNYSSMPQIAKDLVSGEVDFGQLIVPWVFAIHAGMGPFTSDPMPMVITQIAGTHGSALMVRKDADIGSPGDFKGKRLASHSKLSIHYLLAVSYLERQGIRYDRDIEFRIVSLENCDQTMERGDVDAMVMPEPKNAMLQEQGLARLYLSGRQLWEGHPCCALVARKDLLARDQGLVTAVTRAISRAGLTANHPRKREQLVEQLQSTPDYDFDKIPKRVLVNALASGRSDFDPFPYQSSSAFIISLMKKYGMLPRSADPLKMSAEVVQSDLSRSILKELGANPPENNFRDEVFLGERLAPLT
jgi:nitrate/nitrite transport system substrate-binding protein